VTVRFWHSMADDAGRAFETFVEEFNNGPGAEKGIRVEAVFQGQYADAAAKLRPLLQAGEADALPDIMQLDATAMVDYMNTEYAWTVDDALAVDSEYDLGKIIEAPLRNWNYGGRQMGLPVSCSTTVLYYNKTLLDQAGIREAPGTFAEIATLARHLPELNADGRRLTAFACVPNSPLLANWIGQIPGALSASYLVDKRNGRDGDATRLISYDEGTLLTFLEAWKDLYAQGALLNVQEGLSSLFVSGQTALLAASTSNLKALLAQIGGRFELGCAFFPRISTASRFGAAVSGSGLFMFKGGGRERAAWELVKYLCSGPVQARLAAVTGYMPVHIAALDEDTYRAYTAAVPQALTGFRQLAKTSPGLFNLTVGPARDFYYETAAQVSDMLSEDKSPAETALSMKIRLNRLLADYAEANAE